MTARREQGLWGRDDLDASGRRLATAEGPGSALLGQSQEAWDDRRGRECLEAD